MDTGKNNSGHYNSGNRNSGHCNSGSRNSGHCNSGNRNSGHCNSGSRNSGYRNSGEYNSGDYNSGNYNSGNYNSGYRNSSYNNSGNYNSGEYNSGYRNSGYNNSGNYNSGNYNSGYRNSGNYNSGYNNSGNYNSGNYNSGNYNSGYNNSGFFCTETPKPKFFDQEWDGTWEEAFNLIPYIELPIKTEWIDQDDMTEQEKKDHPDYKTVGGYLKEYKLTVQEAFPIVWEKLDQETKDKFLNLPNFDAEKFLKCTGVDVRGGSKKCHPETIVIDGVTYYKGK